MSISGFRQNPKSSLAQKKLEVHCLQNARVNDSFFSLNLEYTRATLTPIVPPQQLTQQASKNDGSRGNTNAVDHRIKQRFREKRN
jgi:hypothetical protein